MSKKIAAAKDEKQGLVPRLRFPEFRDGPEWAPRSLASVLDYERPEKYIVTDTAYLSTGTPVLTANKSFVLGYTHETDGIFADLPVIIFDDFTTDRKYVDFPFKVKSSAIKILKPKGEDDLKLVFELMGGIRFDPKEHKRYYISEYQNLEIPLPHEAEQRKIAACLTSLDEWIAAEGRKLEALKAHKKALMQQLFPRPARTENGVTIPAETVPRLRFPEFRDGPEWSERSLGELGDTLAGLGGKSAEDFGSGEPYVTYKQVFDAPVIDRSQCGRVRVEAGERQTLLRYGDVLFTGSSETPGEVGWASMVLDRLDSPLYLNSFCFAYRFNDQEAVRPEFARHLFHSPAYRVAVCVLAQGAIRYNISKLGFLKIRLRLPLDPEEQRRVADCLASLDAALAAEAAALAALKAHKKGLMQKLFPSPEEA